MSLIARAIAVLTLIVILSIDKTKSECCDIAFVTYHVCLGIPTEIDLGNHMIWDFPIERSEKYWVRNEADKSRPKCVSDFCADGLIPRNGHCGFDCNMHGCGCRGGCRQNKNKTSYEEMGKAWRENYGLSMKVKHQLKGTFE